MSKFKMTPAAVLQLENLIDHFDADPILMLEESSGVGVCYECGSTRDEVEPDASGYECSNCGLNAVSGIETALLEMI